MSATLSDDVTALKKLVLHNPVSCVRGIKLPLLLEITYMYLYIRTVLLKVVLKLEESQLPESSQLTQYHIKYE